MDDTFKFKNYCIIVLDNIDGVKDEIIDISEKEIKLMQTKTVFIATFTSLLTIQLLKELFISKNRNFFVFELKDDCGAGYFMDKKINDILLKDIEINGDKIAEELTKEFIENIKKLDELKYPNKEESFNRLKDLNLEDLDLDINVIKNKDNMKNNNNKLPKKNIPLAKPIAKSVEVSFNIDVLTPKERNEKINDILDKGFDKLTDIDKSLLKQLSEKQLA